MTEAEIAWAAGLFEGEGCIGIIEAESKGSNRTSRWVKLSVQMTDRDVLERFAMAVGTGGVSFHHRGARPNHKDCWSWQASGREDVERILLSFLPWLGERRSEKARLALALIEELCAPKGCEFCGEPFKPYHRAHQRFCSTKCQQASYHAEHKRELSEYGKAYYAKSKLVDARAV